MSPTRQTAVAVEETRGIVRACAAFLSFMAVGVGTLVSGGVPTPVVVEATVAAADGGFYLRMPIQYSGTRSNCAGEIGNCGWINSVFDHSASSPYAEDGVIQAFDGTSAVVPLAERTYLGGRNDATCHGGNPENSSYFALGGLYRGVSPSFQSQLCYDGHPGIDMYGTAGTTVVLAAADGQVHYAPGGANCPPCLNTIRIDHPGTTYSTWYLHIQAAGRVPDGSWVTRGQPIALVGDGTDGMVSPHLHFEVHRGNTPTDPFGWTGSGPA